MKHVPPNPPTPLSPITSLESFNSDHHTGHTTLLSIVRMSWLLPITPPTHTINRFPIFISFKLNQILPQLSQTVISLNYPRLLQENSLQSTKPSIGPHCNSFSTAGDSEGRHHDVRRGPHLLNSWQEPIHKDILSQALNSIDAKKRIYVTIGVQFYLLETLLFTFQIQWILWKINHLSYTVMVILRAFPKIPSYTLT